MILTNDQGLAPVNLSYIASLRYVKPRENSASFRYLRLGCRNAVELVGLAASNPEGQFFGVIIGKADMQDINAFCAERQVSNIKFLQTTSLSEFSTREAAAADWLSSFDYVVADTVQGGLQADESASLCQLAERLLKPNGLLAYRYTPVTNADEALRFLVSEYAPELTAPQAEEFLQELKALGDTYFKAHPITSAALDRAIERRMPDEFFSTCEEGSKPVSNTFETIAALLPRGFAFVGDAEARQNYLELAAPQTSHAVLAKCRDHLLYEPIKDFVTQRAVRTDIWCRLPATQTDDTSELFGHFTFGLSLAASEVPDSIQANGKTIDLTTSLHQRLIELMGLLPCTIGDFLHHPSGKGERPSEVLAALQVLVACGIVRPMRSSFVGVAQSRGAEPQLMTGFNRYLTQAIIDTPRVLLASPVIGNVVDLPAREALVLQAISRSGIGGSATPLLAELRRIAAIPELSAKIMDVAEPTTAIAEAMIHDVVSKSMLRWYSYGIMAA